MIGEVAVSIPRRRYVRFGFILLGAAVVVSGAIAWPIGVMRYAPLRLAGAGLEPAAGTSIEHGGSNGRARLPYQYGKDAYYSWDIYNDGRWGVTISEVVLPPASFHNLFQRVEVRTFGLGGCCFWDAGKPFRPFAMRPGDRASFMVRGRFGGCEFYQPGSGNGFSNQTMKFRFLGVTREFDVEIIPFDVVLPSGFDCPVPRPY